MGKVRVSLRFDVQLYCEGCKKVLSFTHFGGPGHEQFCRACEQRQKYEAAMARTREQP